MHIKLTTTHCGGKTCRYVKVVKSIWNSYKGASEKVIATLGTLEEVYRSRDVLIRGISDLKEPGDYRQRSDIGSRRRQANRSSFRDRQKRRKSI